MKRIFELDLSEADERALLHAHRSSQVDFAFQSVLESVRNSARAKILHDLGSPQDEDQAILSSTLSDADARFEEDQIRLESERLAEEKRIAEVERVRLEEEAAKKAVDDERIRLAVEAILAERDAQPDLFKGDVDVPAAD